MTRTGKLEVSGAGLGLRPEIGADLLLNPRSVDFVEVVVEACFAAPQARREAAALAELWPVVPHGIKLSLGSADGIERERAERLGELARELRSPLISEHVAIVRGGQREIGHLTPVPMTRDAVKVVARNVAAARRHLPDVPLLLENIAWTFRWPEDAMSEADFHAEVLAATGCDMLLDLSNLYANAINAGLDPVQMLLSFPLERVAQVHLAGGIHDGRFYYDTHAHAVPDVIFRLLDVLCERRGPVPVIIERDALFPPFAELEAEVNQARACQRKVEGSIVPQLRPGVEVAPVDEQARQAMLDAQRLVAEILTSTAEPDAVLAAPFGVEAVARTRDVLRRKRVDDALPLLPRLSMLREIVSPLALGCVESSPRVERLAAIADAMRIARAAEDEPRLRLAALVDGLVLEARFRLLDHAVEPRKMPFFRGQRLPSGKTIWAIKGPGVGASVKLFEPRT